jgi:hypothetical protein
MDTDLNIQVGTAEYVWVTFNCPDKGISANSLVMKSRYDQIIENPCEECYSNVSSGTGTINGVTYVGGDC